MEYKIHDILDENKRRNEALRATEEDYDPEMGINCYGERCRIAVAPDGRNGCMVPVSMTRDEHYSLSLSSRDWQILRARHDFEFWCATCVKIKPKTGYRDTPFILNVAQRHALPALEDDRLAGRPMRIILLKSRQWGGSTLVQIYMAWIQILHRSNWHSAIISHVSNISAVIRQMFDKILANYPEDLWPGPEKPALRSYAGCSNTRVLAGLGNNITVGSAENQDAIRGQDYALAHLSEVAFWKDTERHDPADLVRAIAGSVMPLPMTMVVMESTANGVGNFFHTEWLRNINGDGDKRCVFVPWYFIEHCRTRLPDYSQSAVHEFISGWNLYETQLWEAGRTLEQIYWYRGQVKAMGNIRKVHAEFPTTPDEAFTATGANVFDEQSVTRLRKNCCAPAVIGDVDYLHGSIDECPNGRLKIWENPRMRQQYVVSMDIGGRSESADYSVIAVLSREKTPRVVAQWRGHTDHDILARIAIFIAQHYNKAELIIESNTLESNGLVLENNLTVLTYIQRHYKHLYHRRTEADAGHTCRTNQIGFHTNRRTKPMLINNLISYVRQGKYIERDHDAANELQTYVELPNGSYAARAGRHDDILMTRALALYLLDTERLPHGPAHLPSAMP